MFRKKEVGIRAQMFIGLLVIFLVSFLVLYGVSEKQLEKNRENQIARELQVIRENTEIYVRQLLLLNDANNDEESFRKISKEIEKELKNTGIQSIGVYSNDGVNLTEEELPEKEDLQKAFQGLASFTMTYPEGKHLIVFFSMPIQMAGITLGVIRFQMDYTALWQQEQELSAMILRTACLIFAAVFLLSALFLDRILKPIQRLTKISKQITEGLPYNQINIEQIKELSDIRQQDEIGELSRNYSAMVNQTNHYIEQLQKLLESRQEFYNNVTHELKTPLTTIQGFAQLLEADRGEDEELLDKGISHILHESTRMHQMVVQLLEMSDENSIDIRNSIFLDELIQNVAEVMEMKAKRYGCHTSLDLERRIEIRGNEEKLRQLLINLLDNAVKYGKAGSQIEVVEKKTSEGILFFVENETTEKLSSEDLQKIFEPFYRTNKEASREKGSAGLGLSICRKIVKEYKGSIWAEKNGSNRVRFCVLLPKEVSL